MRDGVLSESSFLEKERAVRHVLPRTEFERQRTCRVFDYTHFAPGRDRVLQVSGSVLVEAAKAFVLDDAALGTLPNKMAPLRKRIESRFRLSMFENNDTTFAALRVVCKLNRI